MKKEQREQRDRKRMNSVAVRASARWLRELNLRKTAVDLAILATREKGQHESEGRTSLAYLSVQLQLDCDRVAKVLRLLTDE